MIREHLARVLEGQRLSRLEMAHCIGEMLRGEAAAAQVAALLGALRVRGETVDELVGAALAVREVAVRVPSRGVVVDTCGTGGDAQGTFNVSTAAALVASACGVTVAKHGNRSVSSRCGSADVLEALGARLDLDVPTLAALLEQTRLAFLFAPAHHPAFKRVASLRRELGVRTVFNLLGPLANPAGAQRQVLGVFDPRLTSVMADVLLELGAEHALVVHGEGLDEISVSGPTLVEEVRDGRRRRFVITPEELGLMRHPIEALRGGEAPFNAALIRAVLEGARGGPRDAVLANAAAALVVGGHVETLREGVVRAADVIDSGAASAHLERFLRVQDGKGTMLDAIVARLPEVTRCGAKHDQEVEISPERTETKPHQTNGTTRDAIVATSLAEISGESGPHRPTNGAAREVPGKIAGPAEFQRGVARVRAASGAGRFFTMLSPAGGPVRLIAEVKRRSPSAGVIAAIPDPAAYARDCVSRGAAAISVLTNEADFGGHLSDLRAVRASVEVPVLRKEFIVDPRQLDEAAQSGADAVLLIVAVLGTGLRAMHEAARARGLEALVEVHDELELARALEAGAVIIGINNRDLRTFQVDLSVSERLVTQIPPGVRVVAESGVRSQADLDRLRRAGLRNFLVGELFARGGSLSCE